VTKRQAMRSGTWLCAAALRLLAVATPALAQDAAGHGKEIFQHTCANCHSTKIGVNKIGPTLWDVVGRKIAIVPDYPYSETMRALQTDWQVWDAASLDVYLRNPREAVHGVKMFFKGLPGASDRADIILYLDTLKQ